MKRIKLTAAYDGTNYHGSQIQNNGETIEGVLKKELSSLLQEEINLIGASRTDAGVHARGNVYVFDTESRIPPEKFTYALKLVLAWSFSFLLKVTACIPTALATLSNLGS